MVDEAARLYAIEDESWLSFRAKLPKQENKRWVARDKQVKKVRATPEPALTVDKKMLGSHAAAIRHIPRERFRHEREKRRQ